MVCPQIHLIWPISGCHYKPIPLASISSSSSCLLNILACNKKAVQQLSCIYCGSRLWFGSVTCNPGRPPSTATLAHSNLSHISCKKGSNIGSHQCRPTYSCMVKLLFTANLAFTSVHLPCLIFFIGFEKVNEFIL